MMHAYSVRAVKTLSNGVRLVEVRNPWGSEKYKGPWSDSSDKWTAKFKEEVGFEKRNDGIFWCDLDTYY